MQNAILITSTVIVVIILGSVGMWLLFRPATDESSSSSRDLISPFTSSPGIGSGATGAQVGPQGPFFPERGDPREFYIQANTAAAEKEPVFAYLSTQADGTTVLESQASKATIYKLNKDGSIGFREDPDKILAWSKESPLLHFLKLDPDAPQPASKQISYVRLPGDNYDCNISLNDKYLGLARIAATNAKVQVCSLDHPQRLSADPAVFRFQIAPPATTKAGSTDKSGVKPAGAGPDNKEVKPANAKGKSNTRTTGDASSGSTDDEHGEHRVQSEY